WGLRPVDDPGAKRYQQRPLGPESRIAVVAELATARRGRQHRRWLRERVAAAMPRAGELVDADLLGEPDIALALGVGGVQRHQGLPPLGVGVGVDDLGAGAGLAAPIELPRHDARELVIALAPGRRRLAPQILRLGVLRPRQPGRLGEADVERPSVGGLEQYRAVDHLSPVLVLVETELDERADPAPTLRRAVDDGVMDRVAQRVRRTRRGRGRM